MNLFILLFIFSILSISSDLMGQAWLPNEKLTTIKKKTFEIDGGLNKYGKDTYMYLAPSYNKQFNTNWGFSVQLPVNILVENGIPKDKDVKIGGIRKIDYDDKSDYLRVLNYVYYGQYEKYTPGESNQSIYAGRMTDGKIGHGTIVNKYNNYNRVDLYKVGVQADYNTDYGGAQVFTNTIYDNEVKSGRVYLRPYAIIKKIVEHDTTTVGMLAGGNVIDDVGRKKIKDEFGDDEKKPPVVKDTFYNSIWNKISIGLTGAADAHSPSKLLYDSTGNMMLDKTTNPLYKNTKKISVQGIDFEFSILHNSLFQISPYADFNQINGVSNSKGQHYGVLFKYGTDLINITYKPEYRIMTQNYLPMYFDSFYELEKIQYDLSSPVASTKYEYMNGLSTNGQKRNGYLHSLIFNFNDIKLEAMIEKNDWKDGSRVYLAAYIPVSKYVRLSGFYTKKGFEAMDAAFKVNEKSQGAVELEIYINSWFTIKASERRRWVMDVTTHNFKSMDEKIIFCQAGKMF